MSNRVAEVSVLLFACAATFGCGSDAETGVLAHSQPSMLAGQVCTERVGDGEFEFRWAFDENRFQLTGDSIPPDLLTILTGTTTTAKKLEGDWEMNNEIIKLTNITVDGSLADVSSCSLRSFNTGVLHIMTSDADYLFELAKSSKR